MPAEGKLKIVFDTNIYISAFLKSGFSRELFNLSLEKKIELFCSPAILLELEEKLKKKFQIKDKNIRIFVLNISKIAKIIQPSCKLNIIKSDPQDNIILECAKESAANLIVSLDRHLLGLKKFQKIGIVHPKTLSWIIPDMFRK